MGPKKYHELEVKLRASSVTPPAWSFTWLLPPSIAGAPLWHGGVMMMRCGGALIYSSMY